VFLKHVSITGHQLCACNIYIIPLCQQAKTCEYICPQPTLSFTYTCSSSSQLLLFIEDATEISSSAPYRCERNSHLKTKRSSSCIIQCKKAVPLPAQCIMHWSSCRHCCEEHKALQTLLGRSHVWQSGGCDVRGDSQPLRHDMLQTMGTTSFVQRKYISQRGTRIVFHATEHRSCYKALAAELLLFSALNALPSSAP